MFLIIGASGFIGNKLYLDLKRRGLDVKGTYHTDASNLSGGLYLDLLNGNFEEVLKLKELTHIILCHGISNIESCKKDTELSHRINVTNTIGLLNHLKGSGIVTIYFSTSMVYDGEKKYPDETEKPNPLNEYGRQKLSVEHYIKETFDKYIILRLTKVFGVERSDKTLFTSWLDKLMNKERIYTADDIFISPVFIMDVIRVVDALVNGSHYGVYNIGGEDIMSIYAFSISLAEFFRYDTNRIQHMSIKDFNFTEKRPKFNSVDPTKVKETTNVALTPYKRCFRLMANNYEIFGENPAYLTSS